MDLEMKVLKNGMEERLLVLEEEMSKTTKKFMYSLDVFGYEDIVPKRALYSAWHGDLLELLFDFETKTHQSLMGEIDFAMDSITKAIQEAKIPEILYYRLHELWTWKAELQEWMEMEEEVD